MRLRVLFPLSLRFRQYRVNSCKHSFPCKVILRFTLCCTCGTEAVEFAVDECASYSVRLSIRQLTWPSSAALGCLFHAGIIATEINASKLFRQFPQALIDSAISACNNSQQQ